MPDEFEDLMWELVELFADKGIPYHEQIGAALGFAAYLVTEASDPPAVGEHAIKAFNEMIHEGIKAKTFLTEGAADEK